MALTAAIALSGEDLQKGSYTVNAKACNLNKHGAAVQTSRDLPVGSKVVVRNQRGAQISARVISQIQAIGGMRTFGIEFLEQDDRASRFWGIVFPSA